MKRLFNIIVFLLFIAAGISYPQDLEKLKSSLHSKLEELQAKYKFPGTTFALILKDNREIRFAVGRADKEENIDMPLDAEMCGGSTGKIFVAPVLLQLVNEKKLDLDEKAIKYFENDDWFKKLPNYNQFTVRNLLNHTTGIPEYIIKETFGKDIVANPDKVWKPEELLSYILGKPAVNPVGAGWSYADANYIILGMIIERITGRTFYSELEDRILKPMKLTLTVPQVSRRTPGVVQGYSGDSPYLVAPSKVITDGVFFTNPQFEWTGGGLFTNPVDLARWAKHLWRGDFLPEELNKQMKQAVGFQSGKPEESGYGFAVMRFPTPNFGVLYTHGGIMFGYLSEVFYLENFDCSVAMQINTDPFSGFFRSSLQQIVIREILPLIAQNLEPVKAN